MFSKKYNKIKKKKMKKILIKNEIIDKITKELIEEAEILEFDYYDNIINKIDTDKIATELCKKEVMDSEKILRETDEIFYKILESRGKSVCSAMVWVRNEAKIDNDEYRKILEYYGGETLFKHIMENNSLEKALKILNLYQARIFWVQRGAINDNNQKRKLDDYKDAKRYIGYLLADSILENCKKRYCDFKCFKNIKMEYLKYLVTLSLEEFIRIKAYYLWKESGGNSQGNYNKAMKSVQNTMWNCNKWKSTDYFKRTSIKEYLNWILLENDFKKNAINIKERIKNGKFTTGKRLQFKNDEDIKSFVEKFYTILEEVLRNVSDSHLFTEEEIKYLLDMYYKNTHVPNMLEFILRCFLCTYISIVEHNKIRKKYDLEELIPFKSSSDKMIDYISMRG